MTARIIRVVARIFNQCDLSAIALYQSQILFADFKRNWRGRQHHQAGFEYSVESGQGKKTKPENRADRPDYGFRHTRNSPRWKQALQR